MDNIWNKPLDYNDLEAKLEASRCLSCKKPMCQTGCPTGMRIRDFILEIKNDNLEEAAKIIDSCSSLSNICSVVCPHENQCMGHCILGKKGKPINCGKLEKYVQNKVHYVREKSEANNIKVAVIGGGPAGLACSKELLLNGFDVTIYEAQNYLGGVMTYGIPSYRLDYSDVLRISDEITSLGAKVIYNTKLMESDILKLKETYKYIFIATGLTKVRKLGIPNDNIEGVYDALDFLMKSNMAIKLNLGEAPKLSGTVVVVGAGNVAMDAARTAVRLGASKTIIAYRRSIEEAPATKHEINDAINEGVEFKFLTNPVEVLGSDKVTGVKCKVMKLTEPDESGRRRPVGTNEYITIDCDYIISAIGQIPDDIYDSKIIETDHNYIKATNLKTNVDNIFVGGDIYLGAKTVVQAMRCGRDVASYIIELEK